MTAYASAARAATAGLLAFALILGAYFSILTLVSGWDFTLEQFAEFRYFVLALAAGFGIQIGLYSHLRRVTRHGGAAGSVTAISGGTSTAAMISCCAHYLANVVPVLGATGIVALVAQYQVHLFWVGLALNLGGVVYIGRKTWQAARHMAQMREQT